MGSGTDCDFDCDDENAAIHPEAVEVYDGVVVLGDTGTFSNTSWTTFGSAFTIDHDTVLHAISHKMSADAGSRLAWSVLEADNPEGPCTLVLSEISTATEDTWQDSPTLNVQLEAGKVYQPSLGVLADEQTYWYDSGTSLDTQDGVTPLGSVYGIALGNQNHGIDGNDLFPQEADPHRGV